MALETVGHVVAALADSYAAALECYAGWRETQRQRNHYRVRGTIVAADGDSDGNGDEDGNDGDAPPKGRTMTMCAASASLTSAKLRIEEAFESGADVLGDEFACGDGKREIDVNSCHLCPTCRDVLLENLSRLHDCVAALKRAVEAREPQPLPLSEVIATSEAVRASSLAALHKQYQRLVVGRLMPRVLPAPKRASTVEEGDGEETTPREVPAEQQQTPMERHRTSLKRLSRNSSNTNCEPPSPPPTPTQVPKERPDPDVQSTYARTTATTAMGSDPRPKNSVFSVFCPEAMKYQVDLEKALPVEGTRCRCGYDWNAPGCAEDRAGAVIKDGFQITPRFLGKSHCEQGFGCVLCTSSGRTKTFGSVEGLRAHINSSHTKWQLLHDRDLAGR
ncbi:hypothetical protein GGS24DRAFT_488247 [Hypoxylon argillaceum]|nr:hypothetical protein GGS24DRAFT_488247 [Hypoxylon argillaceum]